MLLFIAKTYLARSNHQKELSMTCTTSHKIQTYVLDTSKQQAEASTQLHHCLTINQQVNYIILSSDKN